MWSDLAGGPPAESNWRQADSTTDGDDAGVTEGSPSVELAAAEGSELGEALGAAQLASRTITAKSHPSEGRITAAR